MSVPSRRLGLRRLVECAVLIAIGTVLSLFEFSGPWALGGGITVCSMLPLVLICHRHGTKWGICSALVYGVLQMFLGMKNVMYGQNFWQVLAIILLDYVVAFGEMCIRDRAAGGRACGDARHGHLCQDCDRSGLGREIPGAQCLCGARGGPCGLCRAHHGGTEQLCWINAPCGGRSPRRSAP